MIAGAKIKYLQEQIARNDDTTAYKELFVSFYNPLLRFAVTLVKSKQQAEEVVSDVFINIWEKRKRINSISNLKVYLFIAVKNTSLNYLSKQNKNLTDSVDDAGIELKSIYFDPEQLMVTAEMVARIKAAIDQLPPKCKLIFKLVKEEELKYKDVAEILNLSVKTVEGQLAIALKKIGNSINFDIKKTIAAPHGLSK
ncbi:MAG TPA: RNA polymerase sigma-70 factor [Chitinophagaceae bacterium]|jgi:RNA polymerase sigma-70 factor (family 1)|nr:RNA polymerase sigma-70 factor [Chitinophagaceae bacterium]